MSWPVLNTPTSASHFWGWTQIILGLLNFVILGIFFAYEALPYLRQRKGRAAVFGLGMVTVSLTSGLYAIVHGVYTLNMHLTGPRGIRALDIGSLIVCFPPLLIFGWERVRLARSLPQRIVRTTPAWLLGVVLALGAYIGAFIMRTVDVARFRHTHFRWWHFDSSYNLILTGLYLMLSAIWLSYQLRVHRRTREWSVLGVSLGLVFVTMAFRRLAQAIEIAGGAYHIGPGSGKLFLWTDIASLLAAVFFLAVLVPLIDKPRPVASAADSGTG